MYPYMHTHTYIGEAARRGLAGVLPERDRGRRPRRGQLGGVDRRGRFPRRPPALPQRPAPHLCGQRAGAPWRGHGRAPHAQKPSGTGAVRIYIYIYIYIIYMCIYIIYIYIYYICVYIYIYVCVCMVFCIYF